MSKPKMTVRVRILVRDPPPGVRFGVQRGRDEVVDAQVSNGDDLVLKFPLTVSDANSTPVRFTGEFAQGPASARFVYINSGTLAGQAGSCWTRRAKVPLTSITPELLSKALGDGAALVAQISGRARDGGPACASVPLLSEWAQD